MILVWFIAIFSKNVLGQKGSSSLLHEAHKAPEHYVHKTPEHHKKADLLKVELRVQEVELATKQ